MAICYNSSSRHCRNLFNLLTEMQRTLTSTVVRKAWTATQSGWTLSFNNEKGADNNQVWCTGSNSGGGSVNANWSVGNNTSSINFNGIAHDSTLAGAIIAEMETIVIQEAE